MMKSPHIYPEILRENISELPYFRAFLRAVEARYYQSLDLPQPILDLGAGDGHFAAKTFHDRLDVGFDPAIQSLQEAKGFNAYRILVNGVGNYLPFDDGSFATVVSNSVLEHIPDVETVIKEVFRVLKFSGKLVITVPNSNFTRYLSFARFFDELEMKNAARRYRQLFNKISRHYHPDDVAVWRHRLENAGFQVIKQWNYFSPESLKILEWGHLFGMPHWFNKKIFNRWILFPGFGYNNLVYRWIYEHYAQEQESLTGAYTFFIAQKSGY